MNQYDYDSDALTNGELVCDYSTIECRDDSNSLIDCGQLSITYVISAADSVYSLLSRLLSLSLVAVASLYLSM